MPPASAHPLLSVVLPVRDGGAFLSQAVRSVLGQTWRDLELLVVDDGSRDGAVAALDRGDRRLRVIEGRGRGVVAAFAAGLGAARGAFVARMDADDVALPERFARQLAFLGERPEVGIAGACVEPFAEEGVGEGNRRYAAWLNALREPADIARELFVESPIPNPTACFRREVLERLGGYRDVPWPEDYDLYLRADAQGVAMGKPAGVLLRWRDHGARLTRTDPRYALERFQAAKAHFLVHHRLRGAPLVIWGAGPTGRRLHDLLLAEGGHVTGFLEVHPRRVGGRKRGLPVWSVDKAKDPDHPPILVAVGARGARAAIRDHLRRAGKLEGIDFLCVS